MNKKPFLNDLQNLNWETNRSIAKKKKNVSHYFRKFLNIVETLLDTYAPPSAHSKADQKRKLKTKGLLTSVKKKNHIYKINDSAGLRTFKASRLCMKNLQETITLY